MARRRSVCNVPQCPELAAVDGKCASHARAARRAADAGRPSTAERGYGGEHQSERADWKRKVDAGGVLCARCGFPIEPGEAWDLDHTDDRSGYLGPSHASCNRAVKSHW